MQNRVGHLNASMILDYRPQLLGCLCLPPAAITASLIEATEVTFLPFIAPAEMRI